MTTTLAPPATHPMCFRQHDDDDHCTEGMSDEWCDDLCTRENKAKGVCRCKRRKDDDPG